MRILFLEPFFGGSHREFAEGLAQHSVHRIELATLPDRFWKWRMRGAALSFFRSVPDAGTFDGIIASGMVSLAEFRGIAPGRCPPALLYFHENQLTYPLSAGERLDVHFGFTHLTSALAARRVLFNSEFHRKAFLDALPGFIHRMPDCRPRWAVDAVAARSGVLHPGCRFSADPRPLGCDPPAPGVPPLILWNHRWEHDKDPENFFLALERLVGSGIDFRLAVLGERFVDVPDCFARARERFAGRIVHWGYVPSRREYLEWLCRAHIAVSTARQENFGIAMVEAVRHGCLPLAPDRLSYPEIFAPRVHGRVLYRDFDDLAEKLADRVVDPVRYQNLREELSIHMARFAWPSCIERYDRELEELAGRI